MRNSRAKFISQAAMIAAIYVVLTWFTNLLGLANGVIQIRISEALTILPLYFPAAIPGVFVGCLISNLLTGCALWDIVFGSLATLIAAFATSKMKKVKYLGTIPPVIANTLIIPPILKAVYMVPDAMWFIYLTVFIGEVLSCIVLGSGLITVIDKRLMRKA